MSSEKAADESAIYEGAWVIALTPAGKFLGKLKPDTNGPDYPRGIRLEPVYEVMMVQLQPQQVTRQLMPILLIPVDIGVGFANDVPLIRVNDFPAGEREDWFSLVRNVRAGMRQLRAARSGLVLPGN